MLSKKDFTQLLKFYFLIFLGFLFFYLAIHLSFLLFHKEVYECILEGQTKIYFYNSAMFLVCVQYDDNLMYRYEIKLAYYKSILTFLLFLFVNIVIFLSAAAYLYVYIDNVKQVLTLYDSLLKKKNENESTHDDYIKLNA